MRSHPQKAAGYGDCSGWHRKAEEFSWELFLGGWGKLGHRFRIHLCFPGDSSVLGEGINLLAPLEGKWLGLAEWLDCVTLRTLLHLSEPQLTDGTGEGSIQTVGTDTASHSCAHGSCPSRTQQEHLPTRSTISANLPAARAQSLKCPETHPPPLLLLGK